LLSAHDVAISSKFPESIELIKVSTTQVHGYFDWRQK